MSFETQAVRKALIFFLIFSIPSSGFAASLDPILGGWWLDGSGRAGIRFESCGSGGVQVCGYIRWLSHPMKDDGRPKTDEANSDPAKQSRPICGLQIVGGFTADGPGEWRDGWIYNPEDGETYRSAMSLYEDGTLHVRGYVGIPLFGKSQIWTRPATALKPCGGP